MNELNLSFLDSKSISIFAVNDSLISKCTPLLFKIEDCFKKIEKQFNESQSIYKKQNAKDQEFINLYLNQSKRILFQYIENLKMKYYKIKKELIKINNNETKILINDINNQIEILNKYEIKTLKFKLIK